MNLRRSASTAASHCPTIWIGKMSGVTLRQLGEDVTEELDYIPGHFVVRLFIRPRMACTCCEAPAQAPLPSRLIERGRPGPGLVSHMLVGKYCDHLPLERHSKIDAREGVDLHRSTLSDWVGRTTTLLEPLADHIGKLVRAGPALFADDTPVQKLRECALTQRRPRLPGSGATCEMNARGAGARNLAPGISSASIGRASTPPTILRAIPARSCRVSLPASMAWFGEGKADERACMVHVRRKFVDEVERTGLPIAQHAIKQI